MPKMEELKFVRYTFRFPKLNSERIFTLFLDKQTLELVQPVREEEPPPSWTELPFSKCRACPLSNDEYKFCPAARSMVEVIEFFADLPSFEEVKVEIATDRRTMNADTTVQEGLRSLMGLIMPTSGCPILGELRPMAYMHLPFSNIDETTFRSVAVYLLGQYFKKRFGGEASFDLQDLTKLYEKIHQVNVDFLGRLRAASQNDANLNSLVSLDVFTMSIPRSIDNQLDKFVGFFLPPQDSDAGPSCKR